MTRSELIQNLMDKNPHLRSQDIEKLVATILNEITETLATGGRVELRGFGAFSVKKRDAFKGRNPRTGDSVDVPAKYAPTFKAGKALREALVEQFQK